MDIRRLLTQLKTSSFNGFKKKKLFKLQRAYGEIGFSRRSQISFWFPNTNWSCDDSLKLEAFCRDDKRRWHKWTGNTCVHDRFLTDVQSGCLCDHTTTYPKRSSDISILYPDVTHSFKWNQWSYINHFHSGRIIFKEWKISAKKHSREFGMRRGDSQKHKIIRYWNSV